MRASRGTFVKMVGAKRRGALGSTAAPPEITFDNYVLAGMNSAMLTVQALRAAGKNLTRAGLISAIEAKGAKFASAGLVPLGYSATSRVGYNGYWVSQLNAKGEGHPLINGPWGAYLDHLKGGRKSEGKSRATDLVVDRTEEYWKN